MRGSLCDFFCGTALPDPAGYTAKHRNFLFVLYMFACAGMGFSCVYGITGVAEVCDGASLLLDDTANQAATMSSVFSAMVNGMSALALSSADVSSMTDAVDAAADSVNDLNDSVGKACKDGGIVRNASMIYFALFCVNVFWGIIAYICKCACPAYTLTFIAFGLLVLAW